MTDDVVAANERAVLGAALTSSKAFEACAAIISGGDFASVRHETIWNAIAAVNAQGDANTRVQADHLLVATRLHDAGELAGVGGDLYLHKCIDECVTPVNAAWYAKRVRKAAQNRRMVALGTRLAQAGGAALAQADRDEVITDTIASLEGINAATGTADPTEALAAEFDDVMTDLEGGAANTVSTGYPALDDVLGGFAGGEVIVVGARPGVGKSFAAQNFAIEIAKTGRPALYFNLEMSRQEMMTRLIANICKVNSRHLNLKAPRVEPADWERIAAYSGELVSLPLHVCDDASVTPARIDALIGAFKRKHPDLGIVVIDYLQLMTGDGRSNSRQEEIASISRAVKLMAKRHDVPIILLSQLNRKSEERQGRRPQISDLRESGAIEQDADVVILLHREDLVPDGDESRAGEMDLMVEKNRSGPSPHTLPVACQPHFYRIRSLAYQPEPQAYPDEPERYTGTPMAS